MTGEEDKRLDMNQVALIRAGGAAADVATTSLYRKHRPATLRYLARHRLAAGAEEDVYQDAFIKFLNTLDTFRGETSVASWLTLLARNAALDRLRKEKNQGTQTSWQDNLDEDDERAELSRTLWGDSTPSPDMVLERLQFEECCDRAKAMFAAKHPVCAQAMLWWCEGWSGRDIAVALGRKEAATRQFLASCKKRLKAYMAPCVEAGQTHREGDAA